MYSVLLGVDQSLLPVSKLICRPVFGVSSNYYHYRGFSSTNCDENKDVVDMPLRIPVKHICFKPWEMRP